MTATATPPRCRRRSRRRPTAPTGSFARAAEETYACGNRGEDQGCSSKRLCQGRSRTVGNVRSKHVRSTSTTGRSRKSAAAASGGGASRSAWAFWSLYAYRPAVTHWFDRNVKGWPDGGGED